MVRSKPDLARIHGGPKSQYRERGVELIKVMMEVGIPAGLANICSHHIKGRNDRVCRNRVCLRTEVYYSSSPHEFAFSYHVDRVDGVSHYRLIYISAIRYVCKNKNQMTTQRMYSNFNKNRSNSHPSVVFVVIVSKDIQATQRNAAYRKSKSKISRPPSLLSWGILVCKIVKQPAHFC